MPGYKFKKGQVFTKEHRKKISETRKKLIAEGKIIVKGSFQNGHTFTKESREKMSKAQRGEKSWRWKGGITKRCRHTVHTFQYKEWRLKVFVRDNFTCQNCRRVGIYITAHHIKSWAKYPELRFVVDNGITLCEECHKKVDPYYHGRKNVK